jgi:Ca-activated chloride channel family protein
MNGEFGQPWWLLALPVILWWFRRFGAPGSSAAVVHSSTGLLARLGRPKPASPGRILRSVRLLALFLLILALARPRVPNGEMPNPAHGIDIMLVCDVSLSMDTQDFTFGSSKISRREALVRAISEFVDSRKNDRIGMIGFAANTYLLSPLTTDGNWIKEVLKLVVLKGGTAIGDGIAAGVDKLTENPARSKVMVVVTDGLNNAGGSPLDAAAYAHAKGVRIYTLEIMDMARISAAAALQSPLSQVAARTGGQYFQAGNTGSLLEIYRQIDRMEKREIEGRHRLLYLEFFMWLLAPGLALAVFELVAANTFWMRLP